MTEKPTYEELEQRVRELERAESECRQALEASIEIEKHIRSLFDGIPLALYRTAEDRRILEANQALAEMLGFSAPQSLLFQDSARFLVRPEEQINQRSILKREGVLHGYEVEFRRRDGSTLWVRDSSRRYHGADGRVYYQGSLEDVTERKRIEAALQESEERHRSIIQTAMDGFWLTDLQGHFLQVNEAYCRMSGYSVQDLMIMSISVVEALETADETAAHIQRLVAEGEARFETRHRRKDGSMYDLEVSAQFLPLEGGRIVAFLRDITERKRAEEALQAALADAEEGRQTLEALMRDIPVGISIADADMHIRRVSRHGLEMMGWPTDRHVGLSVGQILSEWQVYGADGVTKVRTEELPLAKAVMKGETVLGEEIVQCHADGRAIRLNCDAAPIRDAEGRIAGGIVAWQDITERKQAADALRESEDRLRLAHKATNDVVWDWDILRDEQRWNESGTAVFGWKDIVEAPQTAGWWVERVHPEDRERVDEGFFAVVNDPTNEHWQDEYRFRKADGSYAEVLDRGYVLRNEHGEAVRMIGAMLDITERKRAEEEREKLQVQLVRAHKMEAIGTLAGGIAHDFNNILSIIVGNTEMAMLDVPEWSPVQDNLKEVREATLRARELVKQILMFARQKEHTVSNIRLEPIARESIKMLRASIPTMVEIREDIEEDLPSVLADPTQIQQIIMNLCTNAGQVMEAEGGILTFKLDVADLKAPLHTVVGVLPPAQYVRIQVGDTGPGIPPEIMERLFDPFFTTKGVGEGTGLGLAVVHGIVQDRKGGIAVESEEGLGTTFSIYLPVSEVESVEVTAEQKMELPQGTERILFVDDEPMIMKLGQRMLENQGYIVETRASGTDALECFRQDPHREYREADAPAPGIRCGGCTRQHGGPGAFRVAP